MDRIVALELEKYLIYLKNDVLVNHQDSVILDRYIRIMHEEAWDGDVEPPVDVDEEKPGFFKSISKKKK